MRQTEEDNICTESEKVEHGSFTTLVFAATGDMATAVTITYAHIASLIMIKGVNPTARYLDGCVVCSASA